MTHAGDEYLLLAARAEIAAGRHSEALDLLEEVATSSPDEEAQKLLLSGLIFEGFNDAGRASEAYSRARELVPAFAAPILREGVLLYHRGDTEGARRFLHRYLQAEKGNPEALYYLALCEADPARRATFARRLAVLDGTGTWSRDLSRSLSTDVVQTAP